MITKHDDGYCLSYSDSNVNISSLHNDIMKLRRDNVPSEKMEIVLTKVQLQSLVSALPFFACDSRHKGYHFYGVMAVIE